MATHDYIISNASGAAVRADLNNALAAIATNNSSATAPTTTYAYQWWADTGSSPTVMKLRNAANSAWITLFQLDGEWSLIPFENGTAAAPSIYFKDSGTDTGFYSPGADQVGITTGGAVRLTTSTTAFTGTLPWQGQNGTAAAPALSFSGDPNTGVYNVGADQLGISTGGTLRLTTSTTAFTGTLPWQGQNGTAAAPALSFSGDPNTGVYNVGADNIGVSTNGTLRFDVSTTAITSTLPVVHPLGAVGTPSVTFTGDLNTGIWSPAADTIAVSTNGAERSRVDSSGRLLVGVTTARTNFFNAASTYAPQVQLEGTGGAGQNMLSVVSSDTTLGPYLILARQKSGAVGGNTLVASQDALGVISFHGSDGTEFVEAARINAFVDGTAAANNMPGGLAFNTTPSGSTVPTERMRITSGGAVLIGNTTQFSINSSTDTGHALGSDGTQVTFASAQTVAYFGRQSNDGTIIDFRQGGVPEGSISVSGTTVSYNGAHLSRWSQLPSGAERTKILRGTVLSNIDEMCEWGNEDNEQLNRMKVSDVEGDKNVSGVFQCWDDDDDTYTDDFYCAMTGDFIIRIAEGVTVERGDLLMSAGDGTAKPQDDDIIRSKTIAKVTSTNVSCTYDDGSYCVPCVLMAC